jgi:sulfite reductase (NADPH) flavoprotein alpha-component
MRKFSAQQFADALKPLPHREYSIASLPTDGRVEILVRQMRQADGRLGLGSGWLTEYAPLGAEIALRVRQNRSFHPPEDDAPLILIGNGTGMAGLRAHLKARAQQRCNANWLLFGERTRQHDYFYREEIETWQTSGVLQRVDLAFSRDQADRVYVQHKLCDAGEQLLLWVRRGASIYVCGSLEGMATGVATTLKDLLGAEQLEQMSEEGRYRRDVY